MTDIANRRISKSPRIKNWNWKRTRYWTSDEGGRGVATNLGGGLCGVVYRRFTYTPRCSPGRLFPRKTELFHLSGELSMNEAPPDSSACSGNIISFPLPLSPDYKHRQQRRVYCFPRINDSISISGILNYINSILMKKEEQELRREEKTDTNCENTPQRFPLFFFFCFYSKNIVSLNWWMNKWIFLEIGKRFLPNWFPALIVYYYIVRQLLRLTVFSNSNRQNITRSAGKAWKSGGDGDGQTGVRDLMKFKKM